MTKQFKDWVQDVQVCTTVGGDIQVRLDGSSMSEEPNRFGTKARHHFLIGDGFESQEDARQFAITWLQNQITKLQERAA